MMANTLEIIEKLQRDQHPTDNNRALRASRLRGQYETLATHLFHQFEPTKKISQRISRDFMIRLESWLACFESDEDRWIAFRSIEYLFFVGQQEFEELYRCAYEHIIKPWLTDIAGIDIFSDDAVEQLVGELKATWPCPVTDSLRINSFLHITGLEGQSIRPDWLSLKELATAEKIDAYRIKKGIKYLVLIEDFVGSGGQLCRALKFASENFKGPILIIPLIICAPGDREVRAAVEKLKNENLHYYPVSVLSDSCLISKDPTDGEPSLFSKLRNVLKTGYEKMDCLLDGNEFGWKEIGSLVVMYSNCPNNTPPIYHQASSTWTPIFPRSERELKVTK
ncbi:hypothetical protein ALO75_03234 [Pseudomonas syringae pv. coryli]|uniref:PRTase-CE domain-containing protein n=2 Tax=Pseudomonas syringae pv. coryli TaxID=317659 RepID=A0A0P9SE60_9PSED|nr:hypothetical protein ALO75_03234 [Pseudomonas syringae pv. coryli]